jgi:tRNA pseudouridine55 synthase
MIQMQTELKALHGFLIIHKPEGITSYDVIRKIKRLMGRTIRIGHAGTLDPLASGLLIVAIGRLATKLLPAFAPLTKCYRATAKLGELTDTLDSEGTIIKQAAVTTRLQELQVAVAALGTAYYQVPPVFAATKYKGKPMYRRAREGDMSYEQLQDIAQTKAKLVTIWSLSITSFTIPFFTLDACVSHGTYIRSLLRDIAQHAGTHATLYALERYAIGTITLDNALSLDSLQDQASIQSHLISPEQLYTRYGISLDCIAG